jgi:hypothetical protein
MVQAAARNKRQQEKVGVGEGGEREEDEDVRRGRRLLPATTRPTAGRRRLPQTGACPEQSTVICSAATAD